MKKMLSIFLTVMIVLSTFACFTQISVAVSYIKSPSSTTGSAYTSSAALASALNSVFNGDIDIYSNSGCSSEVSMVLGSSMSTSTRYYVKSKTTGNVINGKQCYIYANAVYNKLFNEWVGHGTSFSQSQVIISGGSNTASYSMFSNAGVRCGAYMRTTNNSNGAYNGNSGHSLIILSYDSNYITYLEGNADGKGLIRITKQTWSEFNTGELSGRSRYISHVVQPTASYYNSHYPVIEGGCSCSTSYAGNYICTTSSSNLTIRSGHGTSYSKIGSIPKGATVYVSKASGNTTTSWAHVTYNGVSGYASMQYLSKVTQTHTHSYTGTVTKSPTCTTTGVKTFKCSCGASYTQSIAALGHLYSAYWTVDQTATCTQTGVKSRHCGRCSSRTDITTIPAKGHTSSGWITDTTASVYSAGIKHRECTVCGTVLETVKTSQVVPSKVKLGKISNTTSGVKITWNKAVGADTYQIFRRISSSSWEYIGETSSTAYTDKTAKSGTAYYYTVRGINEGGNGSYDTKGLYIRCVGTPKLTKIANATTSVKITWSKVAGADGYYVYRKAPGATSWTRIANVKKGSTTSYKDTKVSSGKNYTYTVKAYDGGTKSSHDSKGLTIKFLATPKLLYVSTGKSGVTVKWDKVTGASGYIVYRKTGSGSWEKLVTVKGNSKVSYLDKTAKKGKTYTYTVKAYNGSYKSYYNTKGLTIKDKY